MKTYLIRINYSWEGYNGHDHCAFKDVTVTARNQKSAEKKALKQLPSFASSRGMFITEVMK